MALAHLGQLGQLGPSSSLGHFTNNASVIPFQSINCLKWVGQ